MTPPETITPGKWHKFPGVGKKNGNKAGWCRLFDDGTGGVFGCWATGLDEAWQAERGRKWTAEEQAAFRAKVEADRKEREAEEAKRKTAARETAHLIWSNAYQCEEHAYLTRKGVQAYGAKMIHADSARRDWPSLLRRRCDAEKQSCLHSWASLCTVRCWQAISHRRQCSTS